MIHYRLCVHPVLLGAGALSSLPAIVVGTACADAELGDIRRTTRLAALATTAAHTVDNAVERVAWDACRWGIEVQPTVLISGCRIEARQWTTAERLPRCLALSNGIAWHIFSVTMLRRAVPEAPCTARLALEAWQALSGVAWVPTSERPHGHVLPTPSYPETKKCVQPLTFWERVSERSPRALYSCTGLRSSPRPPAMPSQQLGLPGVRPVLS